MTAPSLLPFCVAILAATALCGETAASSFGPLSYQLSLHAGFKDANGQSVAGTEIMNLVPYKGRLYASNSLWMEKDPAVPKACQVLVLDSPKGQWRVEHQFSVGNVRLCCLMTATFSTDGKGNRIDERTLLLAAPDVASGPVNICSRNDDNGEWVPMTLGTSETHASTRAMGLHRDTVTGIDRVFAGTDKLGVLSGVYDPSVPGRIRWEKAPEMQIPEGERAMGFCTCNGKLYGATSRHIYERTDGASPSWRQAYFCPQETSPCGVRGLTAVPNPSGHGEALLIAALSRVRRIDPAAGFEETVELDIPAFMTKSLGVRVPFALSAYNEFMPYKMPGTGELVWLFGFESSYPRAVMETTPPPMLRVLVKESVHHYFAAEARYFIRHAQGQTIRYELAEVTDLAKPTLVAVRAIAVSPFAEDRGNAFYFGGFDCNAVPSHNTAWIYRGERP